MPRRRRGGAAASLRVVAEVDEDPALLLRDAPPFVVLVRVALAQARDKADHCVEVALLDKVARRETCVHAELRKEALQLDVVEVVVGCELRLREAQRLGVFLHLHHQRRRQALQELADEDAVEGEEARRRLRSDSRLAKAGGVATPLFL